MSQDAQQAPQAVLGLVADIQYADKPDYVYEMPGKWGPARHYRQCLSKLEQAVKFWRKYEDDTGEKLVVAQLGDLVDGRDGEEGTREDLEKVLGILEKGGWGVDGGRLVNVVGNHCLDAGRVFLAKRLGLDGWWFVKELGDWWLVVVDSMDVSVTEAEGSEKRKIADEWLKSNEKKDNAVPWNGMFGEEQLKWVDNVLRDAKTKGKKVLVLGHHPLVDGDDGKMASHLAWNADRMIQILEEGDVKAYINGHCHWGGYALRKGIHYVTLESIVDSDDKGSHGIMRIYNDKIVIDGKGCMTSRTLKLKTE